MRIDGGLGGRSFDEVAERAVALEAAGYDGAFTAETAHDPFLDLAIAAHATERIELGTAIAVAFARTPMTLAVTANDLHRASGGRLVLGLGSQIKPHIERRFSMPWSHPAPRMREFILAMRAIWATWNDGAKLDFRGDFYTHTLMTPFFDPGPNPFGTPKVWLAAVGPHMTEVAGEVADGLILHGFTTERYVREVTIPSLERGFARKGRTRDGFEIGGPMFVVTGTTDEQVATARQATKQQVAFYGSTPAYRGVLALHGWGEVGDELNTMSKRGLWVEMGDLITDEILEAFAVVAEPDDVVPMLQARYGPLVDRISFYTPYALDSDQSKAMIQALKG
ncbi:MAG TPA: LLM class F420-dependent oxidoreductase [Acidimicrobiia bacterium]|nr:LLM class F420-dependent oxidoreductase [Acidimicrobiia bacterium]